jgi:hypothetical protein
LIVDHVQERVAQQFEEGDKANLFLLGVFDDKRTGGSLRPAIGNIFLFISFN